MPRTAKEPKKKSTKKARVKASASESGPAELCLDDTGVGLRTVKDTFEEDMDVVLRETSETESGSGLLPKQFSTSSPPVTIP